MPGKYFDDLEVGMTVEVDGKLTTVGRENLGVTDHGASFNGSSFPREITRVQFRVPTAKGVALR